MSTAGTKEKEQDLQIGDLANSYNPFTGECHLALVIGERMCPDNGRILKLLVTPLRGDSYVEESSMEYVGPFDPARAAARNAEVDEFLNRIDPDPDPDRAYPPRRDLDDAFAAL